MAKLTEDQKRFLVCQFACFLTPLQAAAALEEQFGVRIDRRQANAYNPEEGSWQVKRTPNAMAKWRPLFEQTRAAFLAETGAIPIANAAYRLRQLQEMLDDARSRRNHALAASLLEQAAKEAGGSFTNKREHAHSGRIEHEEVTPEAKREQLMHRFAEAAEAMKPPTQH